MLFWQMYCVFVSRSTLYTDSPPCTKGFLLVRYFIYLSFIELVLLVWVLHMDMPVRELIVETRHIGFGTGDKMVQVGAEGLVQRYSTATFLGKVLFVADSSEQIHGCFSFDGYIKEYR